MTLDEAYSELGLSPGASKEDINKAFRALAKEWHPDKNKSPEAEDKFKKINEAKMLLENPPPEQGDFGFGDMSSMFSHMHNMQRNISVKQYPDPIINVNLTFIESINGKRVPISYDRHDKCPNCNGQCGFPGTSPCKACDGKGGKSYARGNMRTMTVCGVCGGSGKETLRCDRCNGEGVIKTSINAEIDLPTPLKNGIEVRAQGGGNFLGSVSGFFGMGGGDHYSDLRIRVSVESDPTMRLSEDGQNIETDINISLLEALKGKSLKVNTIKGERGLKIAKETKSGTKLRMNGYGPKTGAHIFNIHVDYPKDVEGLIKFLEAEEDVSQIK